MQDRVNIGSGVAILEGPGWGWEDGEWGDPFLASTNLALEFYQVSKTALPGALNTVFLLGVCSFDSCDWLLCLRDQPQIPALQPESQASCPRLK